MLLRNFYNMLAMSLLGGTSNKTSEYGEGSASAKTRSGSLTYSVSSSIKFYNVFPTIASAYISQYIYFGTGDTEVTFEDYKLTNEFRLTVNTHNFDGMTYNPDTKTFSNTVRLSLTNATGEDKTVKEIGIYAYDILIYREVLTTPFTIPAGKGLTYTHEFKFTMPQ